ncbi:M20/M25/M40 family metallo-hydrolase [Hufsiella ginkgonis]|uniref:M20/M25/M40 family metallo-hydrolase n=1 Tax=Hufsiella ginkgonis TaxID=2695274 RepID=A0A7K1XUV4_9SPHI|nr:M20/M25/M40 family metallo-hydrolase [Hufsiella ginkgonis]MXV14578.1 M20/M25/M40 family metallo-hydrolase [Hufsiella ginkgonis]
MKINKYYSLALLLLAGCAAQKPSSLVKNADVERIIRTLSADDMQGRGTFTPGIDKAAKFIESEFAKIGLQPLQGESGFRQVIPDMYMIKPTLVEATVDGNAINPDNIWVITDQPGLNWNTNPEVQVEYIKAGEDFSKRYTDILKIAKPTIVYVDDSQAATMKQRRSRSAGRARMTPEPGKQPPVVLIAGVKEGKSFRVNFANKTEKLPLFNVAGMLPGKSKEKELVVFSGHYDHLGIRPAVNGDSIANGADDDASGVTAMISLAKYYKKLNNNERTLIFVAFTGEEVGGYGARYFSNRLNPDDVVAMFNIEMIGKDSKFGPNTAFITGYDRSDFGQILQKNLEGTGFKFHPDPYPEQNLFYRSDNATLAALGVPAHTISTDKIDIDKFYHTVDDEYETLDVKNIVATIQAIALSSRTIVAGTDTPKRIPKLEPRKR